MHEPQPLYPHHCPDCTFLGSTRLPDQRQPTSWADWYVCSRSPAALGLTILYRWGAEAAQYGSSPIRLVDECPDPMRRLMRGMAHTAIAQGLWPAGERSLGRSA